MVNYLMTLERRDERKTKKEEPVMKLRKRLLELNTVERSRKPMNPQLRQELREVFSADVAKLGTLIGRDLSHWQ